MEAAASQRDYVVDASLSLIRRLGSSSARRVGWSVPRGVGGAAAITPAKAKVGTHLYVDPLSRGDVWAYLFFFFFFAKALSFNVPRVNEIGARTAFGELSREAKTLEKKWAHSVQP